MRVCWRLAVGGARRPLAGSSNRWRELLRRVAGVGVPFFLVAFFLVAFFFGAAVRVRRRVSLAAG